MLRSFLLLFIGLSAFPLVACAADSGDAAGSTRLSDAQQTQIREALGGLVPNATVEHIADTRVEGLHEVVIAGQVLYVTSDGATLIQGSLFDIESRTDLTERSKASRRVPLLEAVGPEKRIIFGDADAEHRVTVFTDIDCGYCRRMHEEIAQYNALGIAVEYLFFPRGGENTEAWDKSVAVWCASDRLDAMTRAKAGQSVPAGSCDNPVAQDFELGRSVGVEGTPAIYSEDGIQVGGYLPPQQMLQRLEMLRANSGS